MLREYLKMLYKSIKETPEFQSLQEAEISFPNSTENIPFAKGDYHYYSVTVYENNCGAGDNLYIDCKTKDTVIMRISVPAEDVDYMLFGALAGEVLNLMFLTDVKFDEI